MPFVQMENISHFLRACQSPPLNLQQHDMFLTVDLFEQKDPAQVVQCISAFSRAAHAVNPSTFPTPIGPKNRGPLTPQGTGTGFSAIHRGTSSIGSTSPTYNRFSPSRSPTGNRVGSPTVSSWSRKDDEGNTAPAWNIAQYGYMGGASQGNLGIAFGGRRQITSAAPRVPAKAERLQRLDMEEEFRRRKAELDEEENERRRLRAEEKRKAEEERLKWEEEERQWRLVEEKRRREEQEAQEKIEKERAQRRNNNSNNNSYNNGAPLRGQFLSEYRVEQSQSTQRPGNSDDYHTRQRKELEHARQREQEYEEERQKSSPDQDRPRSQARSRSRVRSRSRPNKAERPPSRQDSWRPHDERHYLRTQKSQQYVRGRQELTVPQGPPRPLPDPTAAAVKTHRTGERLPSPFSPGLEPQRPREARPLPMVPGEPGRYQPSLPPRPLPVPKPANRVHRFMAPEAEDQSRPRSQNGPGLPPRGGMSLLEREMELERQRQREWEEAQVAGIGGGQRPMNGPRPLPQRP